MSARDAILAAARRNAPVPAPRPEVPGALLAPSGGDRALLPDELAALFVTHSAAGGAAVVQATEAEVGAAIHDAYPDASHVASAVPEWREGTVELADASHGLAEVELFVCEGVLGVAENAAVWLPESRLPSRAAPFLAPHVAVVLRREAIVATMHDAYRQLGAPEGFGVFVAGPSKTADIEQSLVVGAHGPLSLTIVLVR